MEIPFFGKSKKPAATPARKSDATDGGRRVPTPRRVDPTKAAPAAPAAEERVEAADIPPPREELPDLEFGGSGGLRLDGSIDEEQHIGVSEGSSRVSEVVEQAAILYANGGTEQAALVLEAAIESDTVGGDAEQAWTLLFELYQMLGQREAFDQRALDFVVRFEKSPPTWVDTKTAARGGASPAPLCNLSGALSAASAKQFEQMQRILDKNKRVRLDVARVNAADDDGCAQMNTLLANARRLKHRLVLENTDALAKVLTDKLGIGRRDNEGMWLLLLEILQQKGDQERFEEWALNYAITFEVSPPSWEARPVEARPAIHTEEPVAAASGDTFVLAGQMLGACTNTFKAINEHSAERDAVVVDFAQVQRMDFICAGMLLNTLSTLAGHGKAVRLTHVSGLVSALLNVVGVGHVATIERRRL